MPRLMPPLMVMWLVMSGAAAAQDPEADSVRAWLERTEARYQHYYPSLDSQSAAAGLPSARKATLISVGVTAAATITGIVMMNVRDPKRVVVYDDQGNFVAEYVRDPDQVVPMSLFFSGIFLGPMAGYIYGDCLGEGLKGVAVRTGTAALFTILAFAADDEDNSWDESLDALALAATGITLVFAECLYDLTRVDDAVRRHNAGRLGISYSVLPTITPGGSVGLKLAASF